MAIPSLGLTINITDVCSFLATKIEAFNDRGKNDFIASTDFEDIIRVLDGCSFLPDEGKVASSEVRHYVAASFRGWLGTRAFDDALAAHLLEAGELDRKSLVHQRIEEILQLETS